MKLVVLLLVIIIRAIHVSVCLKHIGSHVFRGIHRSSIVCDPDRRFGAFLIALSRRESEIPKRIVLLNE